MDTRVVGIVGSLRKGSYNRSLLNAFAVQAPDSVSFSVVEIDTLPFFSEDIESPYPQAAAKIKSEIQKADAVIIATPEYNRGTSAVLKNALDWMSRPNGTNPFVMKPVLVIGASDGNIGTAVAQASVKGTLMHLNAKVLGRPEFYLGKAQEKIDEEGNLTDAKTKEFIDSAWVTLLTWIHE